MIRIIILICITLAVMSTVSQAENSPVEAVSNFYRTYLDYCNKKVTSVPRPKIALSADFSSVVAKTEAACKKYADYPCGWGADGDEYLDSQESDPNLTYQSSGISITETSPGIVKVQLNVYPSITDAGPYYHRIIIYKMVHESGEWVVDDVLYSDGKSTKKALVEEAGEAERLYNKNDSAHKP